MSLEVILGCGLLAIENRKPNLSTKVLDSSRNDFSNWNMNILVSSSAFGQFKLNLKVYMMNIIPINKEANPYIALNSFITCLSESRFKKERYND